MIGFVDVICNIFECINLKMEIELRLRTGREDGDRKWQRKSSWRLWR